MSTRSLFLTTPSETRGVMPAWCIGAFLQASAVAIFWVATSGLSTYSSDIRWPLALIALYVGWKGIHSFANALRPGFDTAFWLASAWLVVIVILALFAGVLPIERPDYLPLSAPAFRRPDLFSAYPFGTDDFGRDEASRVIYGARVSLVVGFAGAGAGLVIGGALGTAAGYFRGRVEAVVNVVADYGLAFPPLVLLLALVAVLRPSVGSIVLGLGLLSIPTFIRLAKATSIQYANREFVSAARTLGATHWRIVSREIVPNVALPLISYALIVVAALIVAEASLSFLGLGIKAPYPTWGNMIALVQQVYTTYPHAVLVPGITLFLTVLALNRVGDRARSRWDPTYVKV